jgi:hypothetical protein
VAIHQARACLPKLGAIYRAGAYLSRLGAIHRAGACPPKLGAIHRAGACPPKLGAIHRAGACPPKLGAIHRAKAGKNRSSWLKRSPMGDQATGNRGRVRSAHADDTNSAATGRRRNGNDRVAGGKGHACGYVSSIEQPVNEQRAAIQ